MDGRKPVIEMVQVYDSFIRISTTTTITNNS